MPSFPSGNRSLRARSAVAAGVVVALLLGLNVDAFSQPKPKTGGAASAKAPKGKAPTTNKPKKGKGAASASASAAPPPPPPPAESVMPPMTATPIPTTVKTAAPPPPPPSDAQTKALADLTTEEQSYEKDAKDFRDGVTTVVKTHYEARRRRVLNGLDKEITIEQTELNRARDEAIKRLEEFVAKYSGPNAQPDATPDAMFRLAALYEEKSRANAGEQLGDALKPAIAIYKRIINEFPKYKELAAVFYYLGHALNDSGRLLEAQNVWRSLVCHNKFPYPGKLDPTDPSKDIVPDNDQDHTQKYWDAWNAMHPVPIGIANAKSAKGKGKTAAAKPKPPKNGSKPVAAGKSGEDEPIDESDETVYRPIYSEQCQPIPQKTDTGQETRYIAEIWWQIGDSHFEQIDPRGGPYNFNRAVTAYRLSMKSVNDQIKNVVYGVSLYKLSWTYFKQQRYEMAVKTFVDLLNYTDKREQVTGDAGADFRKEAADYIAGSLTYGDFQGPAEEEPYIVRSDILDTETNPVVAEQKMRIGIDRVQDPKLIPQDKKWTIEIYKSLAVEYRELNQLANTTAVLELILQKWPMHRDAPLVQDEIARTYDERAKYAKPDTPERDEYARKALDARTKLAQYIGNTPWVDANRDDPEAIQTAERLVKGGLRQAAVEHTNNARALVAAGNQSTDNNVRATNFDKALVEYQLAQSAWYGYLKQDENATDAYESKFWLADSLYRQIEIMVPLQRRVPTELYENARKAAVEVRDSNEDDRFLEVTAQYVVAIADMGVNEQYALHKADPSQGLEERTEAPVTLTDGKATAVSPMPLPVQVVNAIAARDEYAARVNEKQDAVGNLQLFRFQSAQYFFFYGQFDESDKRFDVIYKDQCKKSKYAYLAWEKLLYTAGVRADITGDTSKVRALAEAEQKPESSCAYTDAQKTQAATLGKGFLEAGFYQDAAAAFKKAQEMPDGPERVAQWKKAGALYEAALKAAPDRNEAPEAAINGAFSYKQVGDYDKAIAMYTLFIDKYGDDKLLDSLQKGDKANPAEYQNRVKFLSQAYGELARAYILFFNYRAAAETLDKIASIDRFDAQTRKDSARNALVLYSNLGDKDKMNAERTRFLSFKPSAEDKAEADYIVAAADLKQWDERGDSDSNKQARSKAMNSLSNYYETNKNNAAASRFNVDAAYYVAKMKRSANDPKADEWWTNTVKQFDKYRSTAPVKDGKSSALGSLEGNMAAEADFTLIDEDIHKNFDYDTNHHRYAGTVVDVIKKYGDDAKDAEKYHTKLKRIADVNTYGSIEYVTAALARQGSLYDSLRTGLFNTREPQLKLFTAAEEKTLKQLENSGNDDLVDKAAEFRDKRTQLWRQKRDQELTSADTIMVQRYVTAITIAKKFNVRTGAVNKALQRLAFFTDVIGDAKMGQYSQGIEGFTYQEGMFQKARPGLTVEPDVSIQPGPIPVVIQ